MVDILWPTPCGFTPRQAAFAKMTLIRPFSLASNEDGADDIARMWKNQHWLNRESNHEIQTANAR